MTERPFKDLIMQLDAWYPQEYAEEWDKVGLHFGDPQGQVDRVMVALDLRPQVLQEAIDRQCDTLIVHHPPIFHAIDRFDLSDPQIKLYHDVIQAGMKVYAIHTNYDRARDGMNDVLAQVLQLEEVTDLTGSADDVPSLGRVGRLSQAPNRQDFLDHLMATLQVDQVKLIEQTPRESYERVAVIGGSGSDFIEAVAQADVDAFITGDITYHRGHDFYEQDWMTVDAGHHIEHHFADFLVEKLQQCSIIKGWNIEVVASQVTSDPFEYIHK